MYFISTTRFDLAVGHRQALKIV